MRILAAAALSALVLLAGCTVQDPGAPAPTGTGTTGPTTSPPPGTGANNGGNGGGNGFAPQTGHQEATNATAPGLKVVGDLRTCDAGFCVDAVATNAGPDTYRVSSICVPPWMESMKRDGQDVQKDEPRAYCMAFGTAPMEPGARLEANFTWDEMLWDSGKAEPAPAGGYDWTITFSAYTGEDGAGAVRLDLTFHVLVGTPT